MNKRFQLRINLIIILFIIIIFLFPNRLVYAWTSNFTEDRGPDVSDSSTTWWLTYYGGGFACINPKTNNTFTSDDFQVNDTYGWHEWEYNGTTYVVFAAATQEAMEEGWADIHGWKDYIHYFHYGTPQNNFKYSTFQFKFVDSNDTNIYNGIVLDSCENSVDPTYYGKPPNTQWLDVHVSQTANYPNASKHELFNGKQVSLTSTGAFASGAGTSQSSDLGENVMKWIAGLISLGGDLLQKVIDESGRYVENPNTSIESENSENGEYIIEITSNNDQLIYTRSEIESNRALNEIIQVDDPGSSIETETIKKISISDKVDNKRRRERNGLYQKYTNSNYSNRWI